ncbi:MAG: DUF2934 domain-containing protein [Thermodesulfovibrio sp.]|nr:DUF2934 domain-containing protein [Thermodesulfovibrio sp.]
MVDKEKILEEIRQVAYEIYIQSGCIPGRDIDNWLQAERIVLEKYGLIKSEESITEDKPVKTKKTVKKEYKRKKTSKKTSTSKTRKTKSTKKTKKS